MSAVVCTMVPSIVQYVVLVLALCYGCVCDILLVMCTKLVRCHLYKCFFCAVTEAVFKFYSLKLSKYISKVSVCIYWSRKFENSVF